MAKEKKKKSKEEIKELNWKIAEIIWYAIGFIGLIGGLVFSTLGLLIVNMNGNFKYHPFYGLYQSQAKFIKWLGFGSSYANLGIMLILFSAIYFVIVFYIFANRSDIKERKAKRSKERLHSFKLIIEDNGEKTSVENKTK